MTINIYELHQRITAQYFVRIDYTNYRGERQIRIIRPLNIVFENNEWHPDTQWLLKAEDGEKRQIRMFAMKDIHSWKPM